MNNNDNSDYLIIEFIIALKILFEAINANSNLNILTKFKDRNRTNIVSIKISQEVGV
ncbi:hypothetical protein [Candidatus Nitrosocosmicus oleophilus]|uniref:hypothetical protein n=1 Tax=Candidatus Nitrosocosmicus oleophilus TaxID=1353260 RepID=UPI0018C98249|nr:hypothetical protein [Candidatus Nitrosocosmicus oleophilus]